MMSQKPKAVFMADNVTFIQGDILEAIYGAERMEALAAETEMHLTRVTSENLEAELEKLAEVEVIFSCWGMLQLNEAQLARLPNLKAVFYGGGSVVGFAGPFMECDIVVCSGIGANAIPVAEFCLGQILLSAKGAWRNSRESRKGPWEQSAMPIGPGAYGDKVALLGIGEISRYLLQLLQPFKLEVMAVSNYLDEPTAAEMGISRLCDIDTCFREAFVVSNHFPDKPTNQKILTEAHFASMREGATFINTGRGAQVDEDSLIKVLKARPDLTALLDVQHPEPQEAGSELFELPNVLMTSHIAGSMNDEWKRMADFVIDDFRRWKAGEPLEHQVDPELQKARA